MLYIVNWQLICSKFFNKIHFNGNSAKLQILFTNQTLHENKSRKYIDLILFSIGGGSWNRSTLH